jgi:hypothetical protein
MALRLEGARRLLLTTELRVAEVCFAVGYHSVGTFTSHFTQVVGLSPSRLRRLSSASGSFQGSLLPRGAAPLLPDSPGAAVRGYVHAPALPAVPIFVGLFSTFLARGMPAAWALPAAPGPFTMSSVPDGRYHLLAMAFPAAQRPLASLLLDTHLRVGRAPRPLLVRAGNAGGPVEVTLRPIHSTDPPLVTVLPALLLDHLTISQATTGDVAGLKSASSEKRS